MTVVTVPDHDEQAADGLLSPADRAVRDAVREIVRREVAPRAAAVDARSAFPEASYQALAAAGLAGLLMPESLGGSGHSTVAYAAAMEEITAACGGTSTVYMTQMHCAHPIALVGTDEQRRRTIPALCSGAAYGSLAVTEPDAGSDVASMRTVAERHGDGWVVNGTKTFITTGDRAEVIVLFATLDRAAGRSGITAFLVEGHPPGLRRGRPMRKMGVRGSSTAELSFEDCRLPAGACLGGEGGGYDLSMRSVVKSRVSAAAQGVGHAAGAYAAAVAWATERGLLAASRRDAQPVQFALAGMRSRIAAARALLYSTAAVVDRAERDPIPEVSLAKLHCTDLAVEIATEALLLLGPEGDLARSGVERRLRDAKVGQIYDGTNQVQRMLIARDVRRRMEA